MASVFASFGLAKGFAAASILAVVGSAPAAAGARPARATLDNTPDRQVLTIRVYAERICAARNVQMISAVAGRFACARQRGRVPSCVP